MRNHLSDKVAEVRDRRSTRKTDFSLQGEMINPCVQKIAQAIDGTNSFILLESDKFQCQIFTLGHYSLCWVKSLFICYSNVTLSLYGIAVSKINSEINSDCCVRRQNKWVSSQLLAKNNCMR